jgi:hypothetical protein
MKTEHVINPRPRIRMRIPENADPLLAGLSARVTADAAEVPNKRRANSGSFTKGHSGNVKGRPKGAKGAKATVKKALNAVVETRTSRGVQKASIFEALVKKEIGLAVEGDWRARRTVIELAKWALNDAEGEHRPDSITSPDELTDTGRAIIDWFTEELREQDHTEGRSA